MNTEPNTYYSEPTIPNKVLVGVFSQAELHAPSGVFDEELGRDMTNREFIDFWERTVYGAQGTYGNTNGGMPQEAHDYNQTLREQGISPYDPYSPHRVAIYSRRPPTDKDEAARRQAERDLKDMFQTSDSSIY